MFLGLKRKLGYRGGAKVLQVDTCIKGNLAFDVRFRFSEDTHFLYKRKGMPFNVILYMHFDTYILIRLENLLLT